MFATPIHTDRFNLVSNRPKEGSNDPCQFQLGLFRFLNPHSNISSYCQPTRKSHWVQHVTINTFFPLFPWNELSNLRKVNSHGKKHQFWSWFIWETILDPLYTVKISFAMSLIGSICGCLYNLCCCGKCSLMIFFCRHLLLQYSEKCLFRIQSPSVVTFSISVWNKWSYNISA